VFHGSRWVDAFVATLGKDAGEGYACLKALVPPLKAIPGGLSGYYISRRLEKLLRDGAAAAGFSGAAVTSAIRFVALLVEKNRFRHIDSILPEIERRLDRQNGVLAVTVESAAALDGGFEQALKKRLAEHCGAASINLKTRLVPELLGGYRLRIGGLYIDASLRGQAESMKADLEAAALECCGGTYNG
jgi:F-type H+-transporting ATPase subunit delta